MKLKTYHIQLLSALVLTFALTIAMFTLSMINIVNNFEDISDSVIFVICFIMLILFNGLHIFNTLVSFRSGSAFIKYIAYDDKNNLNRNMLLGVGVFIPLSIGLIIYNIVILFDETLFLGTSPASLKYMCIAIFTLLLVDVIEIELFPLTKTQDKAFKIKRK